MNHNIKLSEELAEFIGIMLGDGNLYYNQPSKIYFIRVCNHTIDDKEYRIFIKNLFKKLFGEKFKPFQYKKTETVLTSNNKNIFHLLEDYGLKRGNKKINNLGIPKWIMEEERYLKACIRGLIDTDGSVFQKSRGKGIPQIEISSKITKLQETFRDGLINMGFKPSNWSKGSNTPNCGLYSREQVFKYSKEIGFNNPKHMKKFINIIKILNSKPQ